MIKWLKNLFSKRQEFIIECKDCGNVKILVVDRSYYNNPKKIFSLIKCLGCYNCDGEFQLKEK